MSKTRLISRSGQKIGYTSEVVYDHAYELDRDKRLASGLVTTDGPSSFFQFASLLRLTLLIWSPIYLSLRYRAIAFTIFSLRPCLWKMTNLFLVFLLVAYFIFNLFQTTDFMPVNRSEVIR